MNVNDWEWWQKLEHLQHWYWLGTLCHKSWDRGENQSSLQGVSDCWIIRMASPSSNSSSPCVPSIDDSKSSVPWQIPLIVAQPFFPPEIAKCDCSPVLLINRSLHAFAIYHYRTSKWMTRPCSPYSKVKQSANGIAERWCKSQRPHSQLRQYPTQPKTCSEIGTG